jgi:tRNA (mo5U34)-methyltransferase
MMEGPVREALAAAGSGATALDLACSEGWFSHWLLEWGASRVVGVDLREVNIRRARLIAEEFGVGPDRLTFQQANVMDLRPAKLGTFDVVLNLGLIYHLENPAGAMRVTRSLTRSLCVVDTLLTLQDEPLEFLGLTPDEDLAESGSFASYVETDTESNPLAAQPGVMSLIPNVRAVEQMAEVAGFHWIEQIEPPPFGQRLYVNGNRGMFVARVANASHSERAA